MVTPLSSSTAITVDPVLLTRVVRLALSDPHADPGVWETTPLAYGIINRVTSGIYRVTGRTPDRRPWSVVLKILHHPPAETEHSFNSSDDPVHWNYWRREALAYGSGLLDDLGGGLRAPRCWATIEMGDGTIALWLEDIVGIPAREWSIERFGHAARHLGQFQGLFPAGRPLPELPWLSRGWLREWTPNRDAARRDIVPDEAAWHHPLVLRTLPASKRVTALRLFDQREQLIAAIEHAPQTVCHFDVWPPNLFAREGRGGDETVLIDWSQVGFGALGEDCANLLMDSLWMQHVPGSWLPELEHEIFEGYLAGLRDVGWRGDAKLVRFVFTAVAGLRFGLLVSWLLRLASDTERHAEVAARFGQPINSIVENRSLAVARSLTMGEEALTLLGEIA